MNAEQARLAEEYTRETQARQRQWEAVMIDPDFVEERRRIIRALNQQQPCPHCGHPMIASTPAGAAPIDMAIDGIRITANDPYVTFCGHPGCGKRLEDCTEHAAWRAEVRAKR